MISPNPNKFHYYHAKISVVRLGVFWPCLFLLTTILTHQNILAQSEVASKQISDYKIVLSLDELTTFFHQKKLLELNNLDLSRISLEDFTRLALRYGTRSKILNSQLLIARNTQLRAKAIFNPTVSADITFNDIHPDGFPQPKPDSTQSLELKSQVTQNFTYGTQVSAFVQGGAQDALQQSTRDAEPVFSSAVGFRVSQSLTQNFLGSSWQTQQNIAKNEAFQAEEELIARANDLIKAITQMFFQLKSQQLTYQSLVDQRKKNLEIFSSAKLFFKRGNVDQSDILNIEARYLGSVAREQEALTSLQNNWYSALDSLGLSVKQFPTVTIETANLSYQELIKSSWQDYCSQTPKLDQLSGYKALEQKYQMAKSSKSLIQDQQKPELNAFLAYTFNNKEGGSLANSLGNSFRGKNGALTLGLSFKLTLDDHKWQANYLDQTTRMSIAKLEADTFSQTRLIEIQNVCRNLNHLTSRKQTLQTIYQKQQARATVARQRFNIGREDFFTATQGELAAITAKSQYEALNFVIEQEIRNLLLLHDKLVEIKR
ncbi:MAG: TolC family protein [Proteobacteria bacterium]|nr:TolC family protein [Pseudomonadota bacterium]